MLTAAKMSTHSPNYACRTPTVRNGINRPRGLLRDLSQPRANEGEDSRSPF